MLKNKNKTTTQLDKKKLNDDAFGIWKIKGSSVAYVRNIRKESEKRLKRLKI